MAGKKWFIVLLALIFCLGAGVGMLSARFLQGVPPANPDRAPGAPRDRDYSQRLAEQLQLSPEQQANLKTVLEDQHKSFVELRARIEPELEQLAEETAARIKAFLSDDQQAKFDQIRAEEKERRARREQEGPAPEGPGRPQPR